MGKEVENISVVIITFNAERKLRECLDSVVWASEIIIADSGSRDNSLNIAKEYTDKIYTREFDNFSNQKNFAISKSTKEWVLSLDADEVVTEDLAGQLRRVSMDRNNKVNGFYIERLNNIYGRFLQYGRPDYQLRFFKKGCGEFRQPVHERIYMGRAQALVLKGHALHYTMDDISHHVKKIDEFTDYDVKYYKVNGISPFWIVCKLAIRPILKFIQHYIFKGAWRDGMTGFIFSVNTVAGEFITHAKYCERLLKGKR